MFKYREQVKHISPRADQNKMRDASASRMNFLSINALILSNILIHDIYMRYGNKSFLTIQSLLLNSIIYNPQHFSRSRFRLSTKALSYTKKNTLKLYKYKQKHKKKRKDIKIYSLIVTISKLYFPC